MEEIERDPLNNRKKERETKKESEAYQRFFFFSFISFHALILLCTLTSWANASSTEMRFAGSNFIILSSRSRAASEGIG